MGVYISFPRNVATIQSRTTREVVRWSEEDPCDWTMNDYADVTREYVLLGGVIPDAEGAYYNCSTPSSKTVCIKCREFEDEVVEWLQTLGVKYSVSR